ncbi:DUF3284 domain-containing protein [Collinsella sp. An2]|uniref:DUF3284 domain-containing protein n=1 Tax=Collinsella sp. An2 TaxID=1965585 RepID=UPI0013026A1F|nr:DUF3284 domain-containing protein [Collinsella sp. An2]
MEITLHLDVTPEEFFDLLARNVAKDIEDATGKTVPTSKFNGYRYEKVVRQGRLRSEMKVRIKSYQPPKRYAVRFTTSQGETSIVYEAEPVASGGIDVTYTEEYKPTNPGFGLNRRLGELRYNFKVRERAKKTLPAMEKYIKQERRLKAEGIDLDATGEDDAEGSDAKQ